MKILYFGNYDPEYGRNRVIAKGLKENGVEVVYCNGGTTGGIVKFFRLILMYLRIPDKRFNFVIVAWPAQETMIAVSPLLSFMCFIQQTPIIVDMLTSHYDGYILDRKRYSPQSFHAQWYKWLDRTAIRLADLALVDCYSAGRFLSKELDIPAKKIVTVFIGTDDNVLRPETMENKEPHNFLVHFHGSFVPLQGAQYIIEAINILRNDKITFQIIGKGQDYKICRKMADDLNLNNINWIDHVSYDSLPHYINKAEICLGTFGGTGKFHRCAANKVYEYMACGKAMITGRSDALEKIAEDGVNMILCNPADGQDLADKIMMLKNNEVLRKSIGEKARANYLERYTPKQIMNRLLGDLKRLKLIN